MGKSIVPTIEFSDFRRDSRKYRFDCRVRLKDRSYWVLKYYSNVEEDLGKRRLIKGKRGKHRCGICHSNVKVIFVIPFDLRVVPGFYCYRCRKKKDIMDIKIAKKVGKI